VDSSNTKSSPYFTAVKTEPNGQTFLVPTEEVPQYEALVTSIFRQYQPDTFTEKLSTQAVVNYQWRLRRVAQLEAGLHALGRHNFSANHSHVTDPAERASLIDADTLAKYQKEFKNLAQQKRFLSRLLKTETAELNRMLKANPKRRGLFLVPKRETN
jgi:hypothetical protein